MQDLEQRFVMVPAPVTAIGKFPSFAVTHFIGIIGELSLFCKAKRPQEEVRTYIFQEDKFVESSCINRAMESSNSHPLG